MDLQSQSTIAFFVLIPLLFINIKRSREILLWEQNTLTQITYLLVTWLLPFLGAWVIYRQLNLKEINQKLEQKVDADTIAGDAFLGIDSVFNPGQEIVKAAKQEIITEQVESDDNSRLKRN